MHNYFLKMRQNHKWVLETKVQDLKATEWGFIPEASPTGFVCIFPDHT